MLGHPGRFCSVGFLCRVTRTCVGIHFPCQLPPSNLGAYLDCLARDGTPHCIRIKLRHREGYHARESAPSATGRDVIISAPQLSAKNCRWLNMESVGQPILAR